MRYCLAIRQGGGRRAKLVPTGRTRSMSSTVATVRSTHNRGGGSRECGINRSRQRAKNIMPNWSYNHLQIIGKQDEIDKCLNYIKTARSQRRLRLTTKPY